MVYTLCIHCIGYGHQRTRLIDGRHRGLDGALMRDQIEPFHQTGLMALGMWLLVKESHKSDYLDPFVTVRLFSISTYFFANYDDVGLDFV